VTIEKAVLSVSHRTTYRYSTYVETAQHLATIRPQNTAWQRVVAHEESIEPTPSYIHSRFDAFGNDVLYFSLESPHRSLQMISETTVELTPRWASLDPAATPEWETVAASTRYCAGTPFVPETEFCFASPNIGLRHDLQEYALVSFTPKRPLAEAAIDLMHRIYADFEYRPLSTSYDTPAHQAFELKGAGDDRVHAGNRIARAVRERLFAKRPAAGAGEAHRGGRFACVGFGVLSGQRMDRSRSDQ
jgi:transglutaminase-like putative cysteine protease